MQTGTQIIAGFLLTLPFQQRFADLDTVAVSLYLSLVVLAAVTTCLMLVPVAMHRRLFGLRVKDRLVVSGHRVVATVLLLIGLLVAGTTALIFYVVLGTQEAVITAAAFGVGLVVALIIYPGRTRRGSAPNTGTGPGAGTSWMRLSLRSVEPSTRRQKAIGPTRARTGYRGTGTSPSPLMI